MWKSTSGGVSLRWRFPPRKTRPHRNLGECKQPLPVGLHSVRRVVLRAAPLNADGISGPSLRCYSIVGVEPRERLAPRASAPDSRSSAYAEGGHRRRRFLFPFFRLCHPLDVVSVGVEIVVGYEYPESLRAHLLSVVITCA